MAFLTFVGLFKILLRSLRSEKSGDMQESCKLAFYHQKQFLLKISHFEPVTLNVSGTYINYFPTFFMLNIMWCFLSLKTRGKYLSFFLSSRKGKVSKYFAFLGNIFGPVNLYISWPKKYCTKMLLSPTVPILSILGHVEHILDKVYHMPNANNPK